MSEARADLPPPTPASSAMGLASGLPQPSGGDVVLPRTGVSPASPPPVTPIPTGRSQDSPPQELTQQILTAEGSGDASVSPKGAIGKGQIMPDTAARYGVSREQLFDPEINARVRDQYIGDLWKRYKDPVAVKVAYNAGEGTADKWLASGKNDAILPAETQRYINPNHLANMMSTGNPSFARERMAAFDRETDELSKRDRAEYERLRSQPDPTAQERAELLTDARQRAARSREMYEDIARHPPPEKPIDALQNFGSIGTMLALLMGGMGRHHMNGALAAAGAMMQAAQANNHEQFERQYKIWDHQSTTALNLSRLESDEVRNLLEDKRMSENERQARLHSFFEEHQMSWQAQQLRAQGLEHILTSETELERLRASAANQKLLTGQMLFQTWLQSDEGKKATEEQVEAKATSLGLTGGRGAGGGPRSAVGMYLQQWKAEHPNATAEELSEASAEFRRQGALEVGFASGILGRQVISLNTVADHILRVQEYGEALRNGKIPLANRIANAIAVAEGKPEVVNFEAGRDIMADEVVRLLTSTGGTERDREGMQSHLASFRSPEQMAGLFEVFKEFTGARFEALRQQYAEGDPKREERFMQEKLTSKGREVFDAITKSKGPDTVVPSAAGGKAQAAGSPAWSKGSATGADGKKIYTDGTGWFHADHTPVE